MQLDIGTAAIFAASIAALFLAGKFLPVPMRTVGKLVLNSVLGGVCLLLLNLTGLGIGLNLFTVLTAGVLGVPGILLLLVLRLAL